MWTRRRMAAALGASLAAGPALASAPEPDLATLLGLAPHEGPYFLSAGLDPQSRLTVPVTIDGRGPFEFVVDTGADRSVLAAPLATRLGLAGGPQVLLHAVDGSAQLPTVRVGLLKAGVARLKDAYLPVAAPERIGADGLLGVDMLQGHNVVMDFGRRRMEIRRQGAINSVALSPNEAVVHADEKFGRLVITDAFVGGVRTLAFIDSGSGVSIGNQALAAAMARRQRGPSASLPVRMLGVVGRETTGEVRLVKTMKLGDVSFTNTPLIFTDVHIFDHWGMNDRPAALLGADLLRGFARVQLDFGVGRVRFLLGGGLRQPILQA